MEIMCTRIMISLWS